MKKSFLKKYHRLAFDFFNDEASYSEVGYGLIYDNSSNKEIASIAATGFFLSALVIGDARGYISHEEALYKARKALETLLKVDNFKGFFLHFITISDLKRSDKSEYSSIDTMLAINGVITVSAYFKDSILDRLASQILDRIDYEWLIARDSNKLEFHMAYNDIKDGSYVVSKPGFISRWNMLAEQLMLYIIAANKIDQKDAKALYEGFARIKGTYKDITFYYSPGNSLFVYQFPLVWLDLKDYRDASGFSWYDNAVLAHQACYRFCKDHQDKYSSFKLAFGISAGDTKNGYRVHGGLPRVDNTAKTDGTVSIHAVFGSLPFIEKEALEAIENIEKSDIKNLSGKYGFYDAYNLDDGFVSSRYYGIDKGLELLALDAYLYGTVRDAYLSSPIIKTGLLKVGLVNENKSNN